MENLHKLFPKILFYNNLMEQIKRDTCLLWFTRKTGVMSKVN